MKLQRSTRLSLAVVITVIGASWVAADAPPGPYFNGFETNTAGWFNFGGGTISRVQSGDTSTVYASGVPAATGNYYARLGKDLNPDSCESGGGPQPIYTGPNTNWGGYSSIFPPGGYTTGVDIYLDVPYALEPSGHPIRLVFGDQQHDRATPARLRFQRWYRRPWLRDNWREQCDALRRKPCGPRPQPCSNSSHHGIGLVHVQAHLYGGQRRPACRHSAGHAFGHECPARHVDAQRPYVTSSAGRWAATAMDGSCRTSSMASRSTTVSARAS